jgi:exopolysaccharide biosynthesis WecB/TagA/CpsF family protein
MRNGSLPTSQYQARAVSGLDKGSEVSDTRAPLATPTLATLPLATPTLATPTLAVIDGWGVTTASPDDAIRAIIARARRGESFTVNTLNLDHLVKLRQDANFRDPYRRATIITADGAPIAWLARRQGARVERTTGADLVEPLVMEAARHKLPVYLFGTSNEVLEKCGAALRNMTGGTLNICGAAAPPPGFDVNSAAADDAIAAMRTARARLVFVALGAPKQELFAARAMARELGAGLVCIGAALDFIAGAQRRAPQVFQTYGMEWLWRLATNPRRLAVRYAQCAAVMVDLAVIVPLRAKLTGRTPV